MNDDLVVQKILKLLENNTAFIGYALNGGIGTKINVRNTETGKTIQALSINVDSSGEVLVVKDSDDGKYKAVTFKAAQQTTERIIQIRKTKPVDDKKIIEYTEADIEVFYLFVKLIDTGNPVNTQLNSTWIRKGSSCTQFVGAYERCNYAAKDVIGGTSYTGLPYKTHTSLTNCLNDDLSPDAKSPHGSGDANGINPGWNIYATSMTGEAEQQLKEALESHDSYYGTNYKRLFGYGSILECGGAMYVQGWELAFDSDKGEYFSSCDFSYLSGFTNDCTPEMEAAGYCDSRGFINSKAPLPGEEEPGQPSVGNVNNSWGHQYGWANLSYSFMYKRHFPYNYLNGQNAQGSFVVFELSPELIPSVPPGYSPWTPGCPANLGEGGPFNGGGGNRFPDGPPKPRKRDMKLSNHKAEIWLGSSQQKEAIKLYELGASDLFSGMYNAFIIKAEETQVDIENRLNRGFTPTPEEQAIHSKFYENWNKNIIDLNINPRVWIYTLNNKPKAATQGGFHAPINPQNNNLQIFIDNLYNRTLNLSVVSNNFQVVHLKVGLTPKNTLSNTDCKGNTNGSNKGGDSYIGQSWEYQKYITIKIKDWKIDSTINTLDTSDLNTDTFWNKDNINRKFLTSFGSFDSSLPRDYSSKLLARDDFSTNISEVLSGNHYEQYNYGVKKLLLTTQNINPNLLYIDDIGIFKTSTFSDTYRRVALSTISWWEMWNKTLYNRKEKRLNSIVGYERNYYQIQRSTKLSSNFDYSGYAIGGGGSNAVSSESYFEYLSSFPKEYVPSVIKKLRTEKGENPNYLPIQDTSKILNDLGLLFYFSDWFTKWSQTTNTSQTQTPSLPSNVFPGSINDLLFSSQRFLGVSLNSNTYNITKRLDTRRWINNLWAQLAFDGLVTVDVDSYRDVEFTLPTNPSQYIKYATSYFYTNGEYSFTTQPQESTEIETVLSPGTLEITKQVTITKPTNVEIDPNMSFLVYLLPNVEVVRKKKEI